MFWEVPPQCWPSDRFLSSLSQGEVSQTFTPKGGAKPHLWLPFLGLSLSPHSQQPWTPGAPAVPLQGLEAGEESQLHRDLPGKGSGDGTQSLLYTCMGLADLCAGCPRAVRGAVTAGTFALSALGRLWRLPCLRSSPRGTQSRKGRTKGSHGSASVAAGAPGRVTSAVTDTSCVPGQGPGSPSQLGCAGCSSALCLGLLCTGACGWM